ncbi:MAG: CPBP family intramembrane metalloprotease [Rhodospirillaceae bacterium]|nr:CPBP family intramembrane metalloprotease [Rhodospirillaceae bacterium]
MRKFADNRPVVFSIGIFVLSAAVALPFVLVFKVLGLELEPLRLIIPIADSIFAIGVLYYLGWLKLTGFSLAIRDIHVLWYPVALAFVPVFMFGTIELSSDIIVFYGLALLFTGVSEEALSRGIILRAMLQKGPWTALIFMSVLFSVGHFSNLFFEDFTGLEMAEKLLNTFGFSILYGAVFLRTFNIWPLIILHSIHDFSFLTSGTAGPYTVEPFPLGVSIAIAIVSIAYGVFIARKIDTAALLEMPRS